MAQKEIRFGVIGAGLMGKEFASAAARWLHLTGLDFRPVIVGVADVNPRATEWFKDNIPTVEIVTTDYKDLLNDERIDAIYCAVPHNLHQTIYIDIIRSGKALLGEKPFGIDQPANNEIMAEIDLHPDLLVRCSSEFPFYPGVYMLMDWIRENRFGKIIEVEAHFWHSSDLNPDKPINWKRMIDINGEYGCMGDLGLHVFHVPLRFGWQPKNIRALLSNIITERMDASGEWVPCETWDNAILATEVETGDQVFPMLMSTKRIAPGHNNTWILRVIGTEFSAEYNVQYPKQIRTLSYTPGGEQAWKVMDVPHKSAYPVITGGIFEFGFSDSILQMWAAFCDEYTNGKDGMQQWFHCATPEETAMHHAALTAALVSEKIGDVVEIAW